MKKILYSGIILIIYSLAIFWNEFSGNAYGIVLGWVGLIIGVILIILELLRKA